MEMDNEIYGYGNSYTTEFRQNDPRLGRWLSADPLENRFPWQSPYVSMDNTPTFLIDPKGSSTHTDSSGNVIAVYNDEDMSVFKHKTLPKEFARTTNETKTVDGKKIKLPVLKGGEKMGETEYWDEFADLETKTPVGRIMFSDDPKFSWHPLIDWGQTYANYQDLTLTMQDSKLNEILDMKHNSGWAPYGPMTGRMLNGKYATARSAGNYLAGMNGVTGTVQGRRISGETYMKLAGAYQLKKLSAPNIAKILLLGTSFGPAPYYGEQEYSGRRILEGIRAGEEYLKRMKK